ncbi:MAG TPA: amino acid racemase [Bacteroidales bacterium]|nr:amino acid racemase [Bacteroidales bacterium]
MKTIGLVGGTGWISSAEYYKIINVETNRRLGGLEFSRCILFSLNYGEIDSFNSQNNKEGIYLLIHDASLKLVSSGADCIVLCANTLHQFADRLEVKIDVPVINIASATADEIRRKNLEKVGLLGTKQTMEMDFYTDKLKEKNIDVIVPELSDRDFIQQTISTELLKGLFSDESRLRFIEICNDLRRRGAEGIVLGCTEIPLLIKQEDISIPLFNTLNIHAMAAVDFALKI